MSTRIAVAVAAVVLAAAALWHPAPQPAFQTSALASAAPVSSGGGGVRHGTATRKGPEADAVVYVAGAVRRPGLYRVRAGERVANAVERAGGATEAADLGAVNLAARALDGDEIYVPAQGESRTRVPGGGGSARRGRRPSRPRSRRSASADAIAPASVDVNAADDATLERVPGIGRAIAARIVEMRELNGRFASNDELLDVAGMTQTRLERALPFLRPYP